MSRNKIRARAEREGWPMREETARGGRVQLYPISALPAEAQLALDARGIEQAPPSAKLERLDDVPEAHLERARAQLAIVLAIVELVTKGATLTAAIERATDGTEHSERSARRWYSKCRAVKLRAEWLSALLPQWQSKSELTECHELAFAFFRDDYCRPQRPAFAESYRRMCDVATAKGWSPIPSLRAMVRRYRQTVSPTTEILRREGKEAVERLYPALERSRTHMHALYAVNADGHRLDIFVRWPGFKSPVRVHLIAWQDLYSGMIIGWRIDWSENADAVRLSFADVVENHGIPLSAYLDNGRAFASKTMTGGLKKRFRFTVRDEEPRGILTELLGCDNVHFTRPYHGQSKPIERAFRDLCGSISKHPAFAGAYTGNHIDAKPEDYGTAAIDLDALLPIVGAMIKEHNTRTGRTSEVCNGRSFAEVFSESLEQHRGVIRRATEGQRRLLLLAAEGIRVSSREAVVTLMHGNRYTADALIPFMGKDVIVRFDPGCLSRGVYVYRADASASPFICHASPVGKVKFDDIAAGREQERNRRAFVKAVKDVANKESKLRSPELGAMHLEAHGVVLPTKPKSNVVALPFGLASTPAEKAAVAIAPTREELDRQARREELARDVGASALASLEGARRRRDNAG